MRPPRASREICNAIALASGLLTWAVVVGPAHAGDSGAADEFSYGLAEMLAGRYATGCPALEASYRLDPRPGTLFTMAECNLRQGKTATALADYDQFVAVCEGMPPAQQASQAERLAIAKQERASLGAVVARVTIRVPDSAPLGTIVRCDDKVIAGPVLVGGLPLDPGDHTIGTEAPGGRTGSLKISLEAGERRSVVAPIPTSSGSLAAPAEALGTTAAPAASHASRRLWIDGAGAAGGLGLLVAGAAGALAVSKASTANGGCDAAGVCASREAADAGNSARALADVATAALAFAAVGFAVAAVLWISEPAASRSATGAAIARW
jgi:hypothetical protein